MWVKGSEVNQPGGYKLLVIWPIKLTLFKIIADFHENKSTDNEFLTLITEICKIFTACVIFCMSECVCLLKAMKWCSQYCFSSVCPNIGTRFFFWKGREESGRASTSYPKYLEMEGDKVCLVDKRSGLWERDWGINKQRVDRDSSHLATLCCDLMRKSNDKHTNRQRDTQYKHHPHKQSKQACKERQRKINILCWYHTGMKQQWHF